MSERAFTTTREIVDLATRALATLSDLDASETPWIDISTPQRVRRSKLARSAIEALRFCAAASLTLDDPSLLPLLTRAVEAIESWKERFETALEVIAEGITHALEAGGSAEEVEELAEHPETHVRRALAAGLRSRDRLSRELLEKLAHDPVPEVRKPARESLGDVPWWSGKWRRDPLTGLTPDEAEQHRRAIEQISELLDRPRYQIGQNDEKIAALAASLPDAIAMDLVITVLDVRNEAETRLPALGAVLVSRAGGPAAFVSLCESWGKIQYLMVQSAHVDMISRAPAPLRIEACFALSRRAVELNARRRSGAEDDDISENPARFMAELAVNAFPSDADPTPILELVLAIEPRPGGAFDWIAHSLAKAIEVARPLPEPVLSRLIEAYLTGCPGSWQHLRGVAQEVINALPREQLRPLAERAARGADDAAAAWGIATLLGAAHDRGRDPPRAAQAARFWEDPRARAVLLGPMGDSRLVVPHLRRALRRGELDLEGATEAVQMIDSLWGGIGFHLPGHQTPPSLVEHGHRERQKAYKGLLGPKALRGPITAEEWAALRAARERHAPWDLKSFEAALRALPEGPWHPDDRAFLDRAVSYAENVDRRLAGDCAIALGSKDIAEADLALLDHLQAISVGVDRKYVKKVIQEARQTLGLPSLRDDGSDAHAPQEGGEWMDEPDDL